MQQKSFEALGISKSIVCKVLWKWENTMLLPTPIHAVRKIRSMQKDEAVEIALKTRLESIQSRGGRISRAVPNEKSEIC
ncbi:hypothetical protein MXB_3821 [Myxobolus squamalis]|nr:hypothetical protein MXB_3821 [Myxobolus squamalis]